MMKTFVRRPFAGKERPFKLRVGEAEELERLCNAGIGAIMWRLATQQFYVADVRETIRLGLKGGSDMSDPEATALVMRNVDAVPLAEHGQLAIDIITAYVNGVPDDVKKNDDQPDPPKQ